MCQAHTTLLTRKQCKRENHQKTQNPSLKRAVYFYSPFRSSSLASLDECKQLLDVRSLSLPVFVFLLLFFLLLYISVVKESSTLSEAFFSVLPVFFCLNFGERISWKMGVINALDFDNEAFRGYITYAGLMLIKLLLMAFLTGIQRFRKGVS